MKTNSFRLQKIRAITFEIIRWKMLFYWERFLGLDFMQCVQPQNLGLDPKLSSPYAPTNSKFLEAVFKEFKISKEDSIIDIGCGKGSAMRSMLKYPFAKVDGLELSKDMSEIAIKNLLKLKSNRSKIFTIDATLFTELDDYNFIYFYNPFPSVVMSVVIDNLIKSIFRKKRKVFIIYNNPSCHEIIISNDVFKKINSFPEPNNNEIAIYSN